MIYLITLLCCFVVVCLNAVLLSEEYDHIIPVALGWVRIKPYSSQPIKVLPAKNGVDYEEVNVAVNELAHSKTINTAKSVIVGILRFIGDVLIVIISWSVLICFLYLLVLILVGIGKLFGFIEELLFH